MKQEDRKILKELAGRIRAIFPDARIWAFGSRARGKAEWDTDLEIYQFGHIRMYYLTIGISPSD